MNRAIVSLVLLVALGLARVGAAAPFTDHFAPVDAALADLQADLEASSDPLEQKAALLVAKARRVLLGASKGLADDARLAQKLIGKLVKALGDDLAILPPPADSLVPAIEAALVHLADDVAGKIDEADVAADALPDGDKKTTKALKALDRALGTLAALAASSGATVEHARAVVTAAAALVKAQLKIARAGGDLTRRNFLLVQVEGGEPYEATQVTARFVESTATLEVESSALLGSGDRVVLAFTVPGVDGLGFFAPAEVAYAESETALFGASGAALDAEVGIAGFDVAGDLVGGTFRATDLPALSGTETRTLFDGGFTLGDLEVVP